MNLNQPIVAAHGRATASVFVVGACTGLIAGVPMMLWSMIGSSIPGLGFWLPAKLVAAAFVGVNAIIYGTGTVLFGLLLHFCTAMAFGIVFTAVARDPTVGLSPLLGLLFGAVVWAVMRHVLLPWIDPTLSARVALSEWSFFVAHLIYGFFVGLTAPAIRRSLRAGHTLVAT